MKSGLNIIHYPAADNPFLSRVGEGRGRPAGEEAGAGAQTVGFQEFIQRVLVASLRPTL